MQYYFFRENSAGQHIYMIRDDPVWTVKSKSTYSGLLRGKLSLHCGEEEILFLHQKSVFKQFLMNFPFVRLFFFNPFILYRGKKVVGQVQRIRYGFSFHIDGDVFELRLHSGFTLSLEKNKHQIAVLSRTADGQYSVKCNEMARVGILLLCCAFFDEGYMVNRGSAIKNIIVNDPYSEQATWTP